MFYYIRKHWAINSLVFLLQILWAAILVWQNVLFMGIFQAVIDLNFRYFAVSLLVFFASDAIGSAINIARSWAKARAIRVMNNSVRQDLSASLVRKGHSAFHAHQTGEYLSWYSNNIKQIENMSWASFYNSISVAAQMIFSLIVLVYVHWSLLIFSIVSAVLVISAPKLFEKRIETASEACAQEQGKAMAKLKDLLSGMMFCVSLARRSNSWRELRQPATRWKSPMPSSPLSKPMSARAFLWSAICASLPPCCSPATCPSAVRLSSPLFPAPVILATPSTRA